ncbi:27399_t:CDS:2 [Dentiscutata erythropus]|uniref:27399_t:CDS:1 n=1 Tax=Dentiscutata erythropus TaxID=1348616 RepID=A0A9N9DK94_9GLOM|nr:27399_t:CDS:2 [Dentiscutata erythropus]
MCINVENFKDWKFYDIYISIFVINYDEKTFKWNLNEDAMATEKLSKAAVVHEGIELFTRPFQEVEVSN